MLILRFIELIILGILSSRNHLKRKNILLVIVVNMLSVFWFESWIDLILVILLTYNASNLISINCYAFILRFSEFCSLSVYILKNILEIGFRKLFNTLELNVKLFLETRSENLKKYSTFNSFSRLVPFFVLENTHKTYIFFIIDKIISAEVLKFRSLNIVGQFTIVDLFLYFRFKGALK